LEAADFHAVQRCKTSPLDVMPRSLLTNCANVFAPIITRHVAAGWNVPGTVQVGPSAATSEEGRA